MSGLRAIGGDVEGALERINLPAYVIDATGVIRWINSAARRIVGDVRGQQFTSVVAPEDRRLSREVFAQKMVGKAPVTDAEVDIVDAHGDRVAVEVSSVPLMRGERVMGSSANSSTIPSSRPRRTRRSRRVKPRCCAF